MRYKILPLLLTISILIVSVATAVSPSISSFTSTALEDDITYKQGEQINPITINITDDDGITDVTLTIKNPLDNIVYDNNMEYKDGIYYKEPDIILDKTGIWNIQIIATDTNNDTNTYNNTFEVIEDTTSIGSGQFELWTCPTNWTFPILYLIISAAIIIVGFNFESSIIGILGSLMLMMSYFFIGACSPVVLSPLAIIGLLLTLKFATE